MADVDVECNVKIYEVNGEESRAVGGPSLMVRSHWNRGSMVVLVIDGKEYTVHGSDFARAIEKAENP